VGGQQFAEARLEPAPPGQHVLLACRPENFTRAPHLRVGTGFPDLGMSDAFAFLAVGEKVLIIRKETARREGALVLQGPVLAFCHDDGHAIGPANIV
jgi:hypothetical protein